MGVGSCGVNYKSIYMNIYPWLNCYVEFWKHIPPNEPFRVLLGDMRDKLYNTRERMRQMLANGKSDINLEDTFTDASQVCHSFH